VSAKGLPIWRRISVGEIVRAQRSLSSSGGGSVSGARVWVKARRAASTTTTRCDWIPGHRPASRRAPVGHAAPPAIAAATGSPWCVDAQIVHEHHRDASAELRARHGTTQLCAQRCKPDGPARAPNPANHHASRADQSRTASRCCPAFRPATADDGPCRSTRESASDAARSRFRLADRHRRVPPAAGATGVQPQTGQHRQQRPIGALRRASGTG